MYEVYVRKLYREGGRTFAEYFRDKWRFQRAHSYRLIHCGRLLMCMKSDVLRSLRSQAHFRPLLDSGDQGIIEAALSTVAVWKKKEPALEVTPGVVASAVAMVELATPPSAPRPVELPAAEVLDLIKAAQAEVKGEPREGSRILQNLEKNLTALARKGTTGISWTDATWNPLQGCKAVSDGCRNCYAAKLLATRMASKFPGIAERDPRPKKGFSPYRFTGEVRLLVRSLGEPLAERKARRYFVNSLSDLFYEKVPDWFVDQVFDVMEKAAWHVYQVLTKRPERMAAYTKKRYAAKTPPKHIWLGVSIENQKEHDRRLPHLNAVRTAVRWMSCEPLLSAVKLDLSHIHWVVVGGESNGGRKMEKEWATSVRDQCKKANVPFFFKQWGDFGENGKPRLIHKKSGLATLDGIIDQAYPEPKP